MTTDYLALRDQLAAVTRERDEADRKAGAAQRLAERVEDENMSQRSWLVKAKVEAGYNQSTSFDVVWAETLAKAQRADSAQALARTLAGALDTAMPFIAAWMGYYKERYSLKDYAPAHTRALKEVQDALAEARAAGLLPKQEGENG